MKSEVTVSNLIKVDFTRPIKLNGQDRINARDVHAAVNSGKDFSNWFKSKIQLFQENQDFGLLAQLGEQTNRGGHNRKDYWVTVNTAMHMSMSTGTEQGKKVRQFFIDCTQQFLDEGGIIPATMDIPDITNPDFLLQLATNYKQACDERDSAIKAKGQISSAREASVMGKLSAAKKDIRNLSLVINKQKVLLDEHKDWYTTVRIISEIPEFQNANTKKLGTSISRFARNRNLSHLIKKIPSFDTTYAEVNSYHIDLINNYLDSIGIYVK